MIMKTYVSIVLRTKTQAVTTLGCLFVSPFVISSFSERERESVKKTIHKLSWLQLPGRQLVVQFRYT